jgi:serine/threonine protein phosphatase PrpC
VTDLATALIDSANAAGGHDNISVVVVEIGSEPIAD